MTGYDMQKFDDFMQKLHKKGIHYDYLSYNGKAEVYIDGDWKHDHAYFNLLVRKAFPNCRIIEQVDMTVTEDTYYATHIIQLF